MSKTKAKSVIELLESKNDYVVRSEGVDIFIKNIGMGYADVDVEEIGDQINKGLTKMLKSIDQEAKGLIKSIQVNFKKV